MERLQGAGLVKAITLRSSPPGADRLLSKGWIASCNIDNRLCYPDHRPRSCCQKNARSDLRARWAIFAGFA